MRTSPYCKDPFQRISTLFRFHKARCIGWYGKGFETLKIIDAVVSCYYNDVIDVERALSQTELNTIKSLLCPSTCPILRHVKKQPEILYPGGLPHPFSNWLFGPVLFHHYLRRQKRNQTFQYYIYRIRSIFSLDISGG